MDSPLPPKQKGPSRRTWVALLQLLVSALVIGLLVREAEFGEVIEHLKEASLGWLVIAVVVKTCSLTLHEVRLWVSLQATHKRSPWTVLGIGYTSGLANAVLPARGGDMVAVALLRSELDVPAPAGIAAVGLTAFLEALAFAAFIIGVLLLGAPHWQSFLSGLEGNAPLTFDQAVGGLAAICLASIIAAVVLIKLVGRLRPDPESLAKKGLGQILRETLFHTGSSLASKRLTTINLVLAIIQVFLLVGCFRALVPAAGLSLTPDLPVLAVCGVITLSAVSAVALPPAYGAGPMGAAIAVFAFFGVPSHQAVAFSALSWIANSMPVIVLGMVPMLRRIRRIGAPPDEATES